MENDKYSLNLEYNFSFEASVYEQSGWFCCDCSVHIKKSKCWCSVVVLQEEALLLLNLHICAFCSPVNLTTSVHFHYLISSCIKNEAKALKSRCYHCVEVPLLNSPLKNQ